MKKQKKIWISLLLSLILIIVLSGCSGLPKTAKMNMTIDPNPVTYNSETKKWAFTLILNETNGIGVTISSVRLDSYNQEEQLINTQIWYEEDIIDWWGSNYLPAFSAIGKGKFSHNSSKFRYTILTVEGVDDNNNPIEATGRVDFLPQ